MHVLYMLIAMVLASTIGLSAQSPVEVRIDAGLLEGVASGGVASFKGIPYANPPTGGNRWRAPQPVTPWSEVRSARDYGSDCLQVPIEGDAAPLGGTLSEDCLFLNVWRPEDASIALPVLVWIPGGGFVNGGTSSPIFDGSAFAREGVVVVSVNYRLGRLGFFAHPALTAEGESPLGNYGLMDQIAALEWVRRNVTAFGGDPARVTIVGESAGGQSVLELMTIPQARDLFHGAVVMSGGGRTILGGFPLSGGDRRWPSAEEIGMNYARSEGIRGTGPEALAALRALPAERVIRDANMIALLVTAVLPVSPIMFSRGPIIDGTMLARSQDARFAAGDFMTIPMMIGTTSGDIGTFLTLSRRRFLASFGEEDQELARRFYDTDGDNSGLAVSLRAAADRTMHEPARFIARAVTAAGQPVYQYRFSYVADSLRESVAAAGHASEIPFMFGTVDARFGSAATNRDRALSQTFLRYVANFVKQGDPNGAGLPIWGRFTASSDELMDLGADGVARMRADERTPQLDLMERVAVSQPRPIGIAELEKPDWTGFIALGFLSTPSYFGSSENRITPLPIAEVAYRERAFASIATTGRVAAFGVHAYDNRTLRISGILGLTPRRVESDADALAGMATQELGLNAGAVVIRRSGLFSQTISVSQGLNDGAGTSLTLGGGLMLPLSLSSAVTVNASAVIASASEMRYDFGVTPGEAAARQALLAGGDVRIRAGDTEMYSPDGGFQTATLSLVALKILAERWVVVGVGSFGSLLGNAKGSPLTRRARQVTIGMGLGYRF